MIRFSKTKNKAVLFLMIFAMLVTLLPAAALADTSANTTGIQTWVTGVYTNLLNRQPDAGGLAFWTDALSTGTHTAYDTMKYVMESAPEFQGLNLTDTQFVDVCYKGILGRPADANGETFWVGEMAKGYSRSGIMKRMMNSPQQEFQTNNAALGVTTGPIEGLTAAEQPSAALSVASVSAIDGTHIQLSFSGVVTQAQANQITANVNGTAVSVSAATLSSDSKTVTLTTGALIAGATYQVATPFATPTTNSVTYDYAKLSISGTQPASATMAMGSSNTVVYTATLAAQNADIKVTSISLTPDASNTAVIGAAGAGSYYLVLTDGVTGNAATVNALTSGKAVFNVASFNSNAGIVIPKGQSKTITVKAVVDPNYAQPGQTLKVYLANTSDITAAVNTTGYNTTIITSGAPLLGNVFTVGSTVAPRTATVVAGTLQTGATLNDSATADVFDFNITTDVNTVDINKLAFSSTQQPAAVLTTDASYALYSVNADGTDNADLSAKFNIAMVNGKLTFTNKNGANRVTVAANTTAKFRIKATAATTPTTGRKIALSLTQSDVNLVDDTTTATTMSNATVTMASDIVGNVFTLNNRADSNSLAITTASTPVTSGTAVFSAAGYVPVYRLTLTANGIADLVFKTTNAIKFTNAGTIDGTKVDLKIQDEYGTDVSAATQGVTASGVTTWTISPASDITIAAGTSKTFTVLAKSHNGAGDLAAFTTAPNNTLIVKLAANTDVTTTPTTTVTGAPLTGPTMTYLASGTFNLSGVAGTASNVPQYGVVEALRFTIAADNNEDINIAADSYLNFVASGITTTAAKLVSLYGIYDAADTATTPTNLLKATVDSSQAANPTLVGQFANAVTITKGTSKTFIVKVKLSDKNGANPLDAGWVVRLVADNTTKAGAFISTAAGGATSAIEGSISASATGTALIGSNVTGPAISVVAQPKLALAKTDIAATTVGLGTTQVPGMILKMDATGSTEDIKVTSIKITDTLDAGGKAKKGLAYYVLDTNGNVLGKGTTVTGAGPYACVVSIANPITITKGSSASVKLAFDSDSTETTAGTHTLSIAATADVTAVGVTTGAAANVTGTPANANAITVATVNEGAVAVDTSSPVGNITASTSTGFVKLAAFKYTPAQINAITEVKITQNVGSANDSSVYKLINDATGSQIGSLTVAASGKCDFTNLCVMSNGATPIIIDVYGSLVAGQTKQIQIDSTGLYINSAHTNPTAALIANVVTGQ